MRVGCLASDQHTQGDAHAHRIHRNGSHGPGHRSRRRRVRRRSCNPGLLQPHGHQGLRSGRRAGRHRRLLERVPGPPGRRRHPGCQAQGPANGHQGDRPRRGWTHRCVHRVPRGRAYPRPDHPGLRIGYSTDPRHAQRGGDRGPVHDGPDGRAHHRGPGGRGARPHERRWSNHPHRRGLFPYLPGPGLVLSGLVFPDY